MKLPADDHRPSANVRATAAWGLGLVALVAVPFASMAQSTGDSARGQRLYVNTALESGRNVSNCSSCHAIDLVRARVAANGGLTFNNARTRLQAAIAGSIPLATSMILYQNQLSANDINDLSAFIANLPAATPDPRASAIALTFSATSINATTLPQTVTFSNGQSASGNFTLSNVSIGGANADRFTISANGCVNGSTFAPGASCAVSITYNPGTAAPPQGGHVATLNFSHSANPGTTPVSLSGNLASQPPAPAPAPSSGGGGALPLTLWAALLPAALFARRRRG